MLQPLRRTKARGRGGLFAIVASRYNGRYVDAMVRAAKAELTRAGAQVQVVRVPGAYEIPLVAKRLARTSHLTPRPAHAALDTSPRAPCPSLSAIICLGVILRGETVHAAHIGEAVSRALMQIQLDHEVPVVHEVLLLENKAQARKRCLDPCHNRGTEAAQTALRMAAVLRKLPAPTV